MNENLILSIIHVPLSEKACSPLMQAPNALTPGTPCFPQHLTTTVTIHSPYFFGTTQVVFFFESIPFYTIIVIFTHKHVQTQNMV